MADKRLNKADKARLEDVIRECDEGASSARSAKNIATTVLDGGYPDPKKLARALEHIDTAMAGLKVAQRILLGE